MPDLTMKVIDNKHIEINGRLIDAVAIGHWFQTTTFGSHTPAQEVKRVSLIVDEIASMVPADTVCTVCEDSNTMGMIRRLRRALCGVTAFGYNVPDEVFYYGERTYYRYSNGYVLPWQAGGTLAITPPGALE